MLNKIIIKMIMHELLNEVFHMSIIKSYYYIKKKKKTYEIKVIASYEVKPTTVTKYKIIYVKNWIELLIKYNNLKGILRNILVENIREDVC